MKRHRRRSASQKMLQQRSEGLDTKSGSLEVEPLQQRGVRYSDLNSSSVAVEPLQQRGVRYSDLNSSSVAVEPAPYVLHGCVACQGISLYSLFSSGGVCGGGRWGYGWQVESIVRAGGQAQFVACDVTVCGLQLQSRWRHGVLYTGMKCY